MLVLSSTHNWNCRVDYQPIQLPATVQASSMVTPSDDNVCIVDWCNAKAYCRMYCVCDRHKTMAIRYLKICNELKIPVRVVKHDESEKVLLKTDVMDTVEVLFAALLFDKWAEVASDMDRLILLKGM